MVHQCRVSRGHGAYPTFSEFASFVKECSERANIPELEELSKTKDVRPRAPFLKSPRGEEAISSGTQASNQDKNAHTQSEKEKTTKNDKKKIEVCLFCKEQPHIGACKKFAEKPHKKRNDFFYRRFLCLGCASSSQHHVASCGNRRMSFGSDGATSFFKACSRGTSGCIPEETYQLEM